MALSPGTLLKGLLHSQKYSDLTVICDGQEFRVHRAIICAQCSFFEKACSGEFSEAQSKTISLEHDDPEALRKMFSFLYTQDYEHDGQDAANDPKAPTAPGNAKDPNWSTSRQPASAKKVGSGVSTTASTDPSGAYGDIGIYILAEKYDVKPLMDLAKKKFIDWADANWNCNDFPSTVKEICESVPPHDKGLRQAVGVVIVKNARPLLSQPAIQSLTEEYKGLGREITNMLVSQNQALMERDKTATAQIEKLTMESKRANYGW